MRENPQCGNADSAVEPRAVSEQRQELPSRAWPVRPQAPPGTEAALLGPHPIDPVDRAAAGARVDPVETSGVETEDAPLGARRERRIPELLLHRGRDGEGLEGVDLPLRGAPPDGVGTPEDAPGAEGLQ